MFTFVTTCILFQESFNFHPHGFRCLLDFRLYGKLAGWGFHPLVYNMYASRRTKIHDKGKCWRSPKAQRDAAYSQLFNEESKRRTNENLTSEVHDVFLMTLKYNDKFTPTKYYSLEHLSPAAAMKHSRIFVRRRALLYVLLCKFCASNTI